MQPASYSIEAIQADRAGAAQYVAGRRSRAHDSDMPGVERDVLRWQAAELYPLSVVRPTRAGLLAAADQCRRQKREAVEALGRPDWRSGDYWSHCVGYYVAAEAAFLRLAGLVDQVRSEDAPRKCSACGWRSSDPSCGTEFCHGCIEERLGLD